MLEWLIECETNPPKVGMNELINCWEDWVPSPLVEGYFPAPVFTDTEQKLIRSVSNAVDAFCDATPESIEDERAALQLPQWLAVIAAAKSALSAMMARGKMPEEEELRL
jgi:hypothetical protein